MILVATGSGTTSAVGFAPLIGGNVGGPARLLAFSLEGAASLPPANVAPEPFPEPPAPRPDAKLVAAGKVVWDTSGCELCHGVRAIGGPGSVPDLRRINSARLELFPMIVRGGLFTPSGMPEFKDYVSEADLPGLQAYIVEQAWIAYDAQQKASAR
jgi:quinohemoprotein ethanol dehydrogenase